MGGKCELSKQHVALRMLATGEGSKEDDTIGNGRDGARRLPHCLFVFTAVIEVKLHISVRFFYFISLHFIFYSSR